MGFEKLDEEDQGCTAPTERMGKRGSQKRVVGEEYWLWLREKTMAFLQGLLVKKRVSEFGKSFKKFCKG